MRILILGSTGYLGSYLAENLQGMDIDTAYCRFVKYDMVINCIGVPDLEYCETHPDESIEANFRVVGRIAGTKFLGDPKIVHFSSYYVYDSDEPCTEESQTTDKYAYTNAKLLAEKALDDNALILRIGKLFGYNRLKQQKKFIDACFLAKDTFTTDRVRFNPTSIYEVCHFIEWLAKQENKPSGIVNFANNGSATHEDVARFIFEIMNKEINLEVLQRMDRPFHNYGRFAMDISKLKTFYTPMNWRDDIEITLEKMSNV